MGDEIARTEFSDQDFAQFREQVLLETEHLDNAIRRGSAQGAEHVVGFELEAWLVDQQQQPYPGSEAFLSALNDPLVVPELSRYNVELNGSPQALRGDAFSRMATEISDTWVKCQRVAAGQGARLVAIGILPTLHASDLNLRQMSPLNRYHAMNHQIIESRDGRPVRIEIAGDELLNIAHPNVLLEAAATSFQVHFQTPADQIVRAFNASCIVSAPLVAVSANSPFLFKHGLWDESRVPLFEQAVDTSGLGGAAQSRVFFSNEYLEQSMVECFEHNFRRFNPLLPVCSTEPVEQLKHLKLHNGTVWRWNRPLVDVSEDGSVRLRIEHRPLPAGPSIEDMIANAAFYIGLAQSLSTAETAPETQITIESARANFYRAAQEGLSARVEWLDGAVFGLSELIDQHLLPQAREGLTDLGIASSDTDHYLDIIAQRARTGQTGAVWQRQFIGQYGRDFEQMLESYQAHQGGGRPVHAWSLAH